MIYICGYCSGKKIGNKHPPRYFRTWNDLIDHLLNMHRYKLVDNRLVRR